MIGRLRGTVAERTSDHVVIDVGGVGYVVNVTASEQIPPAGSDIELHTSLQVREDAMTLYGFVDRGGRELFDLLLTSSGVGPKLAVAALGTLRPAVLRDAISAGDIDTLVAVPGIGKKVAERVILELRERVGRLPGGSVAPGEPSTAVADTDAIHEAREALAELGYSAAEIARALASYEGDAADATTEDLLRGALRHLGGQRGHT